MRTYDLHDLANYMLVRRQGVSLGTSVAHSVPLSGATSSIDFLAPSVTILNGQALRIRGGLGNCNAANNTNQHLLCQSFNFEMISSSLQTPVRAWQLNAVGYPLMASGVVVNVPLDDPVFFDDLLEVGGFAGTIQIALAADVTNNDAAAAHSFTVFGSAVLEVYQYSPQAMGGG